MALHIMALLVPHLCRSVWPSSSVLLSPAEPAVLKNFITLISALQTSFHCTLLTLMGSDVLDASMLGATDTVFGVCDSWVHKLPTAISMQVIKSCCLAKGREGASLARRPRPWTCNSIAREEALFPGVVPVKSEQNLNNMQAPYKHTCSSTQCRSHTAPSLQQGTLQFRFLLAHLHCDA